MTRLAERLDRSILFPRGGRVSNRIVPMLLACLRGMRLAEWQVAPGDLVLDGLLRILGSDGLTSVSRTVTGTVRIGFSYPRTKSEVDSLLQSALGKEHVCPATSH